MKNILIFDIDSKVVGSISCFHNKERLMNDPENLVMFNNLPVDEEYLAKVQARKEEREKRKKERSQFSNIFSSQLNRLMNHFNIEAAPLAKATKIPESTLHGWVNYITHSQDLSSGVKSLAKHFGVTVDFLAFGTPMNDYELRLDDEMADIDQHDGGDVA